MIWYWGWAGRRREKRRARGPRYFSIRVDRVILFLFSIFIERDRENQKLTMPVLPSVDLPATQLYCEFTSPSSIPLKKQWPVAAFSFSYLLHEETRAALLLEYAAKRSKLTMFKTLSKHGLRVSGKSHSANNKRIADFFHPVEEGEWSHVFCRHNKKAQKMGDIFWHI